MKHNFKRVCAFLLAVVMCIGAVLPVFASESGETAKCPGADATHTLENSDATKHTVYNPGCQTLGYTVYKCNTCGTYFADDWMPALDGCVFDETKSEVITPDYCDTEGKTKKWCNTHECYTTITVDVNKGDKNGEHVWGEWVIDGAACTEEGSTRTRTCTLCGKTETEANPDSAEGHKWELDHFEFADDGEVALPHCGEMYWVLEQKKDANGDPMVNADGTPVMELVETKRDIVAVYICSACGAEHETTDVRLGDLTHDFGVDANGVPSEDCFVNYKVAEDGTVMAPTCSDDGVGIYECKNCYYQKEFVVAATGIHDFTEQVEAKDVTCTEDGLEAGLKCVNCDAAPAEGGYKVIPALGHKVTEGTVVKPTCTENGSYICSNCSEVIGGGNYETDEEEEYLTKEYCGIEGLLAIGHIYTEDGEAYVHAPTCTTGGFVVEACIICLEGEITERIPALGHDWAKDTANSKDRTCTDDGVLVEICTTKYERDGKVLYQCNETRTTILEAPGHDWVNTPVDATCYESAYTVDICANCGAEQNKVYTEENVKENWDEDNHFDWIYKDFVTWPTCTDAGVALYFCPKCSAEEPVEVEAFGHDFYKKTPVDANNDGEIDVDEDGHPVYKYETDTKGNKILNVVASIPATCYEDAYDICACTNVNRKGANDFSECGTTNADDYVKAGTKLNHKDSKGNDALVKIATIAPTCVGDKKYGYDLFGCPLCKDGNGDYTYTEERNIVAFNNLDKEHHINAQYDKSDSRYPDGIIRKGNCDVLGIEVYYCDACKSDFQYYVPNTGIGHSGATDKNTITKATCDTEGKYKCDYCGEEVAIPASNHSFGEWKEEVAATCTTAGVKGYYECSKCYKRYDADKETYLGKTDADLKIEKLGHDWSVWSPATCKRAGYWKCSRCDSAPGRTEINVGKNTVSAEYDRNGNGKVDILVPGEEFDPEKHDYQAMLSHDWIKDPEWIKIDENYVTPSGITGHGYQFPVGCENDGYWHYYCQNGCGDEWIDSFEKMTGHTPEEIPAVKATCTSDGWTAGVKCSVCNKILEAPIKVTANHENKAGDILRPGECEVVDGICTPEEGEDRHCVHCDEDIIHDYVVTVVEETCVTYQYTLYVCTVPGCTHQYMKEDPTEGYGEHIAADDPVYDFTKACDAEGSMSIVCKNCNTVLETGVRGHKFTNYVVVKPADIAEAGYETAKCDWASACGCEEVDTRDIAAKDGIKFNYSFDNAVKSGYSFVNTGRIYLTINYTAQNASVNDILLALSYDSDVLTYVNAQLKCTGFDLANCEVGGEDADGKVSIRARANAETAENANVTLPATGEFAVIEFAIKADVFAANASQLVILPTIDIDVLENVDAGSVVVDKDHNDIAHNFGEIKVQKIEKLGDVNNDGVVDDRDAVLLFDYLFSGEYSAEADINQNGNIDINDFKLLKQYTISSISYADMCAGEAA